MMPTVTRADVLEAAPPAVRSLLESATEAADHIEDLYRMSLAFASKREKDKMVRDHVILKPLRKAIADTLGELLVKVRDAK